MTKMALETKIWHITAMMATSWCEAITATVGRCFHQIAALGCKASQKLLLLRGVDGNGGRMEAAVATTKALRGAW